MATSTMATMAMMAPFDIGGTDGLINDGRETTKKQKRHLCCSSALPLLLLLPPTLPTPITPHAPCHTRRRIAHQTNAHPGVDLPIHLGCVL